MDTRKPYEVSVILSIVMILTLFFAGCAKQYSASGSFRYAMDSWIGRHISQVIQAWGEYTQVASDGADGKVYIWIEAPNPPPPPASNRGEESWVIQPYGLHGYEIRRGPVGGGGVSSVLYGLVEGTRNVLENARREAARYPRKMAMFTRQDGTVYWWRVERNNTIYDYGKSVNDYDQWVNDYSQWLKNGKKGDPPRRY